MSKLDFIIAIAEKNIEKRSEAQHTDTTHTDYSDSCIILS